MKPIVVLGMHRSGTSAVTRALGLLGAAIGREESTGDYWENRRMRGVNEDILACFGGAWECPPVLDDGWLEAPEIRAVLPRGRDVLAEEYGGAPVVVWKDPRTCITLPFWRQVFAQEPVIVFIYRHPFEVARSLLARDGLGRGHAFALWERYNADALVNSVGLPTAVIEYERLIEDPIGTMTDLASSLDSWGVRLLSDAATTELELSPKQRHHYAAISEVFDDPSATEAQRRLFRLLREVNGTFERFSLPQPPPPADQLSVELLGLAAQVRANRDDARAARSELNSLLGSRRRLLRQFLNRTLPPTWHRQAGRRNLAGAHSADPPTASTKRRGSAFE